MSGDRQPYLQSQRPFFNKNILTSLSMFPCILLRGSLTIPFFKIPSLNRYSTANSIHSRASSGLTRNNLAILSSLTAWCWRCWMYLVRRSLLVVSSFNFAIAFCMSTCVTPLLCSAFLRCFFSLSIGPKETILKPVRRRSLSSNGFYYRKFFFIGSTR